MLRLSLLRHGRAQWPAGRYRDYDRPLDGIGLLQADKAARELADSSNPPSRILCSSALRTAQTAAAVNAALAGRGIALIEDQRFYMASLSQLLQLIGELGGEATHLLIVGHNPGLSELAQHYQLTHSGLDTGQLCSAELPLTLWQSAAAY
jgi:phosphohistidine phosphatase